MNGIPFVLATADYVGPVGRMYKILDTYSSHFGEWVVESETGRTVTFVTDGEKDDIIESLDSLGFVVLSPKKENSDG